MKKNYMELVGDTLEKANRYALQYGDGKAWDNRKKKIYARHTPRGTVYGKLRKQEWKTMYNDLVKFMQDAERIKESLNGR